MSFKKCQVSIFVAFVPLLWKILFSNSADSDQTPHVASDLGLHCLPSTLFFFWGGGGGGGGGGFPGKNGLISKRNNFSRAYTSIRERFLAM